MVRLILASITIWFVISGALATSPVRPESCADKACYSDEVCRLVDYNLCLRRRIPTCISPERSKRLSGGCVDEDRQPLLVFDFQTEIYQIKTCTLDSECGKDHFCHERNYMRSICCPKLPGPDVFDENCPSADIPLNGLIMLNHNCKTSSTCWPGMSCCFSNRYGHVCVPSSYNYDHYNYNRCENKKCGPGMVCRHVNNEHKNEDDVICIKKTLSDSLKGRCGDQEALLVHSAAPGGYDVAQCTSNRSCGPIHFCPDVVGSTSSTCCPKLFTDNGYNKPVCPTPLTIYLVHGCQMATKCQNDQDCRQGEQCCFHHMCGNICSAPLHFVG